MKFVYEYRTSDNVRHSGTVSAASRDAAFAALRAQGIRPGRMEEAPGLLNKVLGKGKRWLAIFVLLALVGGLSFALVNAHTVRPQQTGEVVYATADGFAVPIERRQIWGDDAVIEQAAQTNWKVIFANPADRLLSLFAQPGFQLKVFPRVPETIYDDFKRSLSERVAIGPSDLDEYKQMKCIVQGMKDEMRTYLAAGGKVDGYLRRLGQRQREEADFVERAKKDLANRIERGEDTITAWQETNRLLREQGLKSIPMPSL